jgi:hypothetical protein
MYEREAVSNTASRSEHRNERANANPMTTTRLVIGLKQRES